MSPLRTGQVFQTLDGTTRIYCMPFTAAPAVCMWQLSFPLDEVRLLPLDDVHSRHQS